MDVLKLLRHIPVGGVVAVAAVAQLWVMSGSPTALDHVPDLVGLRGDVAQRQARASGYLAHFVIRPGPGRAGTVLDQRPDPGTLAGRSSAIDLFVTEGAPQVAVPDVRGMPVHEARQTLIRAGLEPGDVTYRRGTGAESDRVISSDPKGGSVVDAGSKVSIIAAA
jgi:serine/threonine-protein kinase